MSATSDTNDSLKEQAFDYWRSKGRGITAVRKIMCDVIFETNETFNADQLLARVRAVDKAVSLSTVYRNLHDLVEAEVLYELEGADDKRVFAVASSDNNGSSHIVCRDCKQVIPIENPCLSIRESALARQKGFSPKRISLRLEASCDELGATGHCKNHEAKDKVE